MVQLRVVETGLLVYLFGMAAWVIWQTGGAAVDIDKGWEWISDVQEWEDWGSTVFALILAAIVLVPIGLYWGLQARGKHRVSFWMVSTLALAPQMPAALSFNRVDWLSFWKYPMFTTTIPQSVVALLLLVSLLILLVLHRAGDLRRLREKLSELGLERKERGLVVRNEALILGAIAAANLGITGALLTAGMALSELGDPLEQSPWPVVSIGAVAILLLAVIMALWVRRAGPSH